ncbi:DMP19 family protein [Flavobacterium sp. TR2]|uniref:DMP19 family protein n=1 Tax=Flavobacterium sp. TR2 TaxID=2977321 RepID=UPI0021B0F8E4|nr:DMP19 family protein [Flavobacterium sp. TR2]UWY29966.1 DMP19 family protein [Flavobacterium sp. TR2]
MKLFNSILLLLLMTFSSCLSQIASDKEQTNISSPTAYIEELEAEVNNGGFNQYFFNSSGQNCFETLKALKKNKKFKTAKILESAINLINPKKLPSEDLIKKLQNREVEELNDEKINAKLELLDLEFYKYPDGNLEE